MALRLMRPGQTESRPTITRRSTFLPAEPDESRIAEATRLYAAAVAWAEANELEQVMFR